MFQNKKNNVTKGREGEVLALKYLVERGYTLLAQNWRYGRTEIDLIFENQGFIVFVEVKLRQPNALVEPHLAVDKPKQRRIVKAADAWLKEREQTAESRFDIVAILLEPGQPPQIDHLEGAFYAYM